MSTPTHLDSFEQQLLTELRSVVVQRSATPTRAPRSRRIRLAAVAAAGTVAAATGAAVLTGGSPAFAVESGTDGSTVIRILELTDADELEAALAERGVTADVEYGGSGSTITVDQDGGISVGDDLAFPEGLAPEDPTPMDSTFTNGPSDDPGSTCGLTAAGTPPIALERDGDEYVVTLAGPTLAEGNALELTTVTGSDGTSLVASYRFGDTTCGAMVSL
ncbi:hypothetical protein [Nocardioides sp. W7]|uniref:hypothetical protein n=1 Tax=Nocardioides sp. W7 TaxID=2931390 RepID=UPI001FD334CA|nr:hypothetical protein [Nocardioides sp. W7]